MLNNLVNMLEDSLEIIKIQTELEDLLEKLKNKKSSFINPIVNLDYFGISFKKIKLGFQDHTYKSFLDPKELELLYSKSSTRYYRGEVKIQPLYPIFDNKMLQEEFLPRFVDLAKKERDRIIDFKNKDLQGYTYLSELVKFILDPKNLNGKINKWVLNVIIDKALYKNLSSFIKTGSLIPHGNESRLYYNLEKAIFTIENMQKTVALLKYLDFGVFFKENKILNRGLAKVALMWFRKEIKEKLHIAISSDMKDLDTFRELL